MSALNTAEPEVQRVLVVVAHPDDADFGVAGTVASWCAAGVKVTYCICTSGEAGEAEGVSRDAVAELRRREQRDAAEAVGVTDVHFLDYLDGEVMPSLRLRKDITRVIRNVRPDRVVTHSPEISWNRIVVSHPDHRAVGEATFAAIYPDARNAYAHTELIEQDGLQPWTVRELWLSSPPDERINHAVDISDHYEAKLAALRAHRSQTGHIDDLDSMLRSMLRSNAEHAGLPAGRMAETFQVVDTS